MAMKANRTLLFLLFLVALASCRKEDPVDPEMGDVPSQSADTDSACIVGTLSLEAIKLSSEAGNNARTKGLDLDLAGTGALNAYWRESEKVYVFKTGPVLGFLNVNPYDGEKPVTAFLTGSIDAEGLAVNQNLTLLTPRSIWSYLGQNGTLTGANSIEEDYDYALATVTVASIAGGELKTAANASFKNQQSIYRFGFKSGGNYIDPKSITINANGGKLVQSINYVAGDWTPVYGVLPFTPAPAPADHFYYFSLRNDRTADDTYTFLMTGPDNALYLATKVIPASLLDAPGKFISAKEIAAVKADFSPVSSGSILIHADNVL